MSYIVKTRKARKDYICESEWAHDHTIRKGDLYVRLIEAPAYLSGDPWKEYTFHTFCAESIA